MTDPTTLLIRETAARMRVWRDRALHCMDQLNDEQVWYRPNPNSNAIGNLVLHLVGNLRQWVVGGIGGQPDSRNRAAEFAAQSGKTRSELASLLDDTVEESCVVIEAMPGTRVLERKRIQDDEVTLGQALVMAVSHLALHVGQIQYIAKLLLSEAYEESWKPK